MRKFYQTEWHGIDFQGLCSLSPFKLADSQFYNIFYQVLFRKYPNYSALDPRWRQLKDQIGDWLIKFVPHNGRVLSIGCGLGYIEQRIWSLYGKRLDIHVQDYASDSLIWLRNILPPENIHIDVSLNHEGSLFNSKKDFDLIYLSAVDYALTDEDLINLLEKLKSFLSKGGRIIIVSASFLDESFYEKMVFCVKELVKKILYPLGFYKRIQFWGWMRTRSDYLRIMNLVNASSTSDGFIESSENDIYWIYGCWDD